MGKNFIYAGVIISGASVLAIELLGTRVIAPFYGASLYLWSALISVTLAALSLGYAIGGRWADRGARVDRFCIIIGLAGLWVSVIPWLRIPVLAASEPLGLRAAVLACATVLFFPPLTLLGMVSPYAIRLKAHSLDVVGRTAGNLYAISTLASVFAALATGFVLIPNMGVTRLFVAIGLLLMATAAVGLMGYKKRLGAVAAVLVVLLGVALFGLAPVTAANPILGIVAVEDSPYAEIRVVDLNNARLMLIDGSMHTGIDLTTGQSVFEYVNVLDIPRYMMGQPGSMLLIGLGGGSVMKNWTANLWKVEVVELDPAVTRIANDYFGLGIDPATVHHLDGREFLRESDKSWDVIVMDAFGSSYIPFQLVSDEAFALMKARLTPRGILAVNVQCVGWRDPIVLSLAATVNRHFAHVLALPIAEPPDQLGNLVLLASDRDLVLYSDLPLPDDRFGAEYDRAHAWDNRFTIDTTGVLRFTDDLNPIGVWSERVNLVSRRQFHEYLRDHPVAW